MTLMQRLQQDYFDSLSERWNTDGTRKSDKERVLAICNQMMAHADALLLQRGSGVAGLIDLPPYQGLNPDVAKLKYGEVGFCDQ